MRTDDNSNNNFLLFYYIKQVNSYFTITVHHRRCQYVLRHQQHTRLSLVCHSFVLPHFDIICDLLPNRHTATSNLFVKWTLGLNYTAHHSSIEFIAITNLTRIILLPYQKLCQVYQTQHAVHNQAFWCPLLHLFLQYMHDTECSCSHPEQEWPVESHNKYHKIS